ncbi:MAG TPA: hypothetical protein VM056_02735 [Terriglobales bacterium]|nr:hypothetical protein [Terriglobales bacterium]
MTTKPEVAVSPDARQMLRHTVATVAYRGGKSLRGAPASFASFTCGESTRTPSHILAHIGDLYDWALTIAQGNEAWATATPLAWDDEAKRFFATLKKFDEYLESGKPLHASAERIFQGAIADSLTHVGQLNMMRRMAGSPVKGESYYRSEIVAGRVGPEQTAPKREFD